MFDLFDDIYNTKAPFFTDVKDLDDRKKRLIKYNIFNMLRRTLQMFEWKLEYKGKECKRITKRNLEFLIQLNGVAGIIEHKNELYALYGSMGGEPNWNLMPTKFIIANAYLNFSGTFNLYDLDDGSKKNCVVIPNDSLYRGMIPIFNYNSEQIAETELTKRALKVWLRAPHTFSVPSSNAAEDVKSYLSDLEKGKLAFVLDKNLLKNITDIGSDNTSARGILTQILECLQYEKASYFNECGMQMNYNMKRETITSSEAQLGEGALLPLQDDMMDMRKKACKEINELFDANFDVEFASAWRNLRRSIEFSIASEIQNNSNQLEKGDVNGEVDSDLSSGDGHGESVKSSDDIDGSNSSGTVGDNNDGSSENVIEEAAREVAVAAQNLEDLISDSNQLEKESDDEDSENTP